MTTETLGDWRSGCVLTGAPDETGQRPYRTALWRAWRGPDPGTMLTPTIVYVMLNPSVADHEKSDQTLARCKHYAEVNGAGRLVLVNLYALRSTDPEQLAKHPDPIGPNNDGAILSACTQPAVTHVVAAWSGHKMAAARAPHVEQMLADHGVTLYQLGPSIGSGAPRHPSRTPNGLELVQRVPSAGMVSKADGRVSLTADEAAAMALIQLGAEVGSRTQTFDARRGSTTETIRQVENKIARSLERAGLVSIDAGLSIHLTDAGTALIQQDKA